MIEVGSQWRRWDLHLHTPGTAMNDQFAGVTDAEKWENYVTALEGAGEFGALGVTDYLSLGNYWRLVEFKAAGRLQNVGMLVPNIELRILPVTESEKAINVHVLACPTIASDLETLLLRTLEFRYSGNPYSCTPQSLASLGRAYTGDASLEHVLAERTGIEQFKVEYGQIDRAFRNSTKLRQHALVAVAQHSTDGNSGIQESGLRAVRAEIYRQSHIILSGNPKDRIYFLGQGVDSPTQIREQYGTLKPCITGSDAHALEEVGQTPLERHTWIKADPSFEGLRQILFEPEHRVSIGKTTPTVPMHRLRRVRISLPEDVQLKWDSTTSQFCFGGDTDLPLAAGLTCIIGGRGAGKSTLLNLIHEKLAPGKNGFWKEHQLRDSANGAVPIAQAVHADFAGDGMAVEFISQNEVETLALDPTRLTKAMYQRLSTLDGGAGLSAAMDGLANAGQDALRRVDLLREAQRLVDLKSDLEARLVGCEELLACFSEPEYLESTRELQLAIAERGRLSDDRNALQVLLASIELALTAAPAFGDTRYGVVGREVLSAVQAIITATRGGGDLEVAQADELALDDRATSLRSSLETFLSSRGLSAENLSDVASASDQKAELSAAMRQAVGDEEQVQRHLTHDAPLESLRNDAEQHIQALLARVNAVFETGGTEARRIEIKYRFDEEAAGEACVEWLLDDMSGGGVGTRPRIDHARGVLDRAGPIFTTSDAELLAAIAADETKTGQALDLYFAKRPRLEVWAAVRARMQADLERFMRLDVLYDGKRLEQTSFGQRCSAVLISLLSLGNRPIVVDEPEAHLDSALIAGFMVDLLKRIKRDRQVIFATHNANFVVNGDAELVHILQVGAEGRTSIVSTTLEDLAHRDKILALEGGEQAFRQREDRYGLDP